MGIVSLVVSTTNLVFCCISCTGDNFMCVYPGAEMLILQFGLNPTIQLGELVVLSVRCVHRASDVFVKVRPPAQFVCMIFVL